MREKDLGGLGCGEGLGGQPTDQQSAREHQTTAGPHLSELSTYQCRYMYSGNMYIRAYM